MCWSTRRLYTKSNVGSANGNVGPSLQMYSARPELVVAARAVDHRRSNVDADARFEMTAQRLSQASDPAAEIERSTPVDVNAERLDKSQRLTDLLCTGSEEVVLIPTAQTLVVGREDHVQRIEFTESMPGIPKGLEVGGVFLIHAGRRRYRPIAGIA